MNIKKIFIAAASFFAFSSAALYAQDCLPENYYGMTFHGNMMGKLITADMTIVSGEKIEFTANLPAGKKHHTYSFGILSAEDGRIVTQWYENGKKDKTVTFSAFEAEGFLMEVKGKGKVKMEKVKE